MQKVFKIEFLNFQAPGKKKDLYVLADDLKQASDYAFEHYKAFEVNSVIHAFDIEECLVNNDSQLSNTKTILLESLKKDLDAIRYQSEIYENHIEDLRLLLKERNIAIPPLPPLPLTKTGEKREQI